MSFFTGLRCKECGREYPKEPLNVCDFCFGPLEAVFDYDAIGKILTRDKITRGPQSMWRYRELLPVEGDKIVDINGGYTPLIKAENLGKQLGLRELYLKNDTVNPTFSFKDRVVSVATTRAKEMGFDVMACASTGNLACSVAAHAAKAGMRSYVFIPADLERGKIVGAAVYGPTLVAVQGSYDEVNRLCSELADSYKWAFANINIRPYYSEGSKTLAFEVAEQLGWRAPDHAVVPVASGSMFTKIWQGFNEFARLGLIPEVHTRMHVTQGAGCSPIVNAYNDGIMEIRPIKPKTLAKSLAIGNPADGYYALKTIKASEGTATAVPEDEILEGIKLLSQSEGIFAETAGGVVIAGLWHLVKQGVIKRDDLTVAYITGNGLKTLEAVESMVNPLLIEPTVSAFEKALKER